MKRRFACSFVLLLAAGLCACAHETVVTHSGPPVYRDQDLEEATAGIGRHLDTSERLGKLEAEMTAVKVELSRLSGAAQRIEARQLQTGGVTPEPASASATPIEDGKPHKHAKKAAAAPVVAESATPAVAENAAPSQETASAGAAAPAAKTAPETAAPPAAAPASAEAPTAGASPAPEAPPDAGGAASGNPGYGLQLGAYASPERAAAAWESLKSEGGKLLADLLPKHEAVTVEGKTLYRLKAGPLPDEATARGRCDGLKAQNMPCLVAPFSGAWPSS